MIPYVKHEFHLLSSDVRAVGKREGIVDSVDHPRDVDQPDLEESQLNED